MRQRGKACFKIGIFWKDIVEMGLDFWWIDADISVVKDIRKLPVRGDMNFQIDGPQRTTVRDGQLHVEGPGWKLVRALCT